MYVPEACGAGLGLGRCPEVMSASSVNVELEARIFTGQQYLHRKLSAVDRKLVPVYQQSAIANGWP